MPETSASKSYLVASRPSPWLRRDSFTHPGAKLPEPLILDTKPRHGNGGAPGPNQSPPESLQKPSCV